MTLQQLYYFVTVCRYGNISRAAEECGISQPSISVAIKNLEREFGLTLIKRKQTGFVLTPDGETFRRHAESLLSHADNVNMVMHARGRNRHLLRLGMPPMASAILFPAIYSGFCVQHPDIEFFTKEAGRDDLLTLFEDNSVDMALLPHTDAFPVAYRSIPIMRFETVCCVPREHALARKTQITPADLKDEPLALFASGFFQTSRVLKMFNQAGIKPQVMHTSTQLSTIENMICSRVALGFLFRELVEKHEDIVPVSLEPKLYTQISLVWRKDSYMSEGMEAFVAYIKERYPSVR